MMGSRDCKGIILFIRRFHQRMSTLVYSFSERSDFTVRGREDLFQVHCSPFLGGEISHLRPSPPFPAPSLLHIRTSSSPPLHHLLLYIYIPLPFYVRPNSISLSILVGTLHISSQDSDTSRTCSRWTLSDLYPSLRLLTSTLRVLGWRTPPVITLLRIAVGWIMGKHTIAESVMRYSVRQKGSRY